MAQLIVRNLEDELVRKLKILAAEHGHSTEEEHRAILRRALTSPDRASFKTVLLAMPDVADDEDFARDDDRGRDVQW